MTIRSKDKATEIRHNLFEKLKEEHAFWSYDTAAMSESAIADDQLIALTMRHLDLPEINLLFTIFPKQKIKKAWRELLVPEGEYLYTLNRFFAWYYFGSKKPDSYLKAIQTRHLNNILK